MKQTVNKGKSATSKRSSDGALTPLTKAQQELVTINIPFAMNMGKKYAGLGCFKGVPMEDLQQEACFGLCIAAQKFNPSRGVKFQTYAHDWCLKYIMKAINDEPTSLLSPEEEEIEDIDLIDDDDEQNFAEERVKKVEAMLAVLNQQEKKVVCLIYGFGSTGSPQVGCDPKDFKEIAVMMHIQVARVHQIYEKALAKMEFSIPL